MSDNCQVEFLEHQTQSGHILGQAILDAPASLNSLTLEMIKALFDRLSQWQQDERVVAVVLSGNGGKAFCAGGDIRKLHGSVLEHDFGPNPYGEEFFTREYRLDHLIHTFGKPVLCWGAGIVMGGGIGLMAGASHRVVSPSSKLAMPEVSIGLFPDVGGSWILGRMPGRVGLFLGLTGARLNATDALFCGLADRFLDDDALPKLLEAMTVLAWQSGAEAVPANHQCLSELLRICEQERSADKPVSSVQQNFDAIQQVTDADNPQAVLSNIQAQEGEWWQRAAASLQAGCPMTAHIVFEQLAQAKHLSLADVFRMELNVAVHCLRNPNFAEGVRALLLERGSTPQWSPATLQEVEGVKVKAFFDSPWSEQVHPLADL
ncbi:enoyl-CoA hydratase/isomerase family protein [Parendozoicomonas haliclonae]|uniref:3-hydroxyisobutyryl-CoA hydrolase n=1 Tax=Parendozoicomonas haliclonae TaxID=1960125 RepID=A0A1X7AQ41_9GAMM|nr:enoyl-CoA hydratase/isomerase family protein [Parendozoicomonas haliclonae]SMA50441.1 Carnitinyl-CoA dehydratase [Parendozoicomonas haliclonae]